MNRKIAAIALIFSVICLSSKAQVEKQVEVTRAYVPQIEPATKLRLEPDMSDTVRMRPEIDYSIQPRSIETTLSAQLYEPATVTYWEFNRPKTAYVKGGVGYPLASVADLYISNSNYNTNYVVGYLNHEGEYGKVTNDFDEKVSGLNTQNKVGVGAGVYLGSRILEGAVDYSLDMWSRSATMEPKSDRSTYQAISFDGRYGDSFVDLTKWNYNFGLDASYMFDAEQNKNAKLGFGVDLGGAVGSGNLFVSVGYDYVGGSNDYQNSSFLLGAKYAFDKSGWNLRVGGDFYYDKVSSSEESNPAQYIIPHLTIRNSANSSIQPFVELDGELKRYNFASLTSINPYVMEGMFMVSNSVEYSLRGGIMGVSTDQKLSYVAYINYTLNKKALYWGLVEDQYMLSSGAYGLDNYYTAQSGKLQGLSVNLDLEYRPTGDLTFKVGGSFTDYTPSEHVDLELGRPTAKLYLGGEYATNTLCCGITADLKSSTHTTLTTTYFDGYIPTQESVEIPTTINLKAFAEVALKKDLLVFVELDNIANSKQFDWMGYRKYGINALAGVKFQF